MKFKYFLYFFKEVVEEVDPKSKDGKKDKNDKKDKKGQKDKKDHKESKEIIEEGPKELLNFVYVGNHKLDYATLKMLLFCVGTCEIDTLK